MEPQQHGTNFAADRLVKQWLIYGADPVRNLLPIPASRLSPSQFQQLIEEAEAHGVLPAVVKNLSELIDGSEYASAHADAAARQRMSLCYSVMLRHYSEAIRKAAAGLSATIVKGPSFARLLYSDSRLRPFTDIDLLVTPAAVPVISRILKEHGFVFRDDEYNPERHEAKWVHKDSPLLMVEVHTNLVHQPRLRTSLSLTYDDIADAPESPAALLAIATLHGALHRFERIRQVVDICQAARAMGSAQDEAQFEKLLNRTGGRFAAIAGLDLAYRLFREPRCRELAIRLGSLRHRVLTRTLIDHSAVTSTMNRSRFFHSWRRQLFRLLLQRSDLL